MIRKQTFYKRSSKDIDTDCCFNVAIYIKVIICKGHFLFEMLW